MSEHWGTTMNTWGQKQKAPKGRLPRQQGEQGERVVVRAKRNGK